MDKFKPMIAEVAKERLSLIINTLTPSQYTSELRKDLEQDLWLELYIVLTLKPDDDLQLTETIIKKHLSVVDLRSTPDAKIVYLGERIEQLN